jgi:hypothetical protein
MLDSCRIELQIKRIEKSLADAVKKERGQVCV